MKSIALGLAALVSTLAVPAVAQELRSEYYADRGTQPAPDTLTGTELKCAVQPPATPTYTANSCGSSIPYSNYTVLYKVFAPAGGSYSFAWTVPPVRHQAIASGCTSTSNLCYLSVARSGSDTENTISVVVTDLSNGATLTDDAYYLVLATCANPIGTGWVWC